LKSSEKPRQGFDSCGLQGDEDLALLVKPSLDSAKRGGGSVLGVRMGVQKGESK